MDAAAVTSTSDAPIGDKVQTSTPGPQSPTQPHSLPLDSCLRRHTKLKRNMAPADDENPPCAYVCLSVRLSVRPPVHPMCIHSSIHQTVSIALVLRSASLARSSSSNEAFKERHHCSYILTRDCISWHYLSSTTAHPHSPITCFTFIDWPSSSDSVYVKHLFNHLLSFFFFVFFLPTSFIIADPAGRKFQGPRHPFFRSCLTHEPMHMHITPMRLNACRSSRLTYFSPRFHTWPISPKV